MSRVKDRERAKQFVYRGGSRISRAQWDKFQKELRELAEEKRLKALGLTSYKPKLAIAERVGLKEAPKRIMTLEEVFKGGKYPIKGTDRSKN